MLNKEIIFRPSTLQFSTLVVNFSTFPNHSDVKFKKLKYSAEQRFNQVLS